MTMKKGGSLTFPADPLAAMRELSELDDPALRSPALPLPEPEDTPPNLDVNQDSLTSRHQDVLTDSKQSSQRDGKIDSQTDEQIESHTDRKKSSKTSRAQPAEPPVPASDGPPLDPLDRVLLEMLGRPYPDLAKGKSTLISSRLPDDVVERLGLAADLVKKHKKTKQDVITRGLILAFQELVEADGAVEWYE